MITYTNKKKQPTQFLQQIKTNKQLVYTVQNSDPRQTRNETLKTSWNLMLTK